MTSGNKAAFTQKQVERLRDMKAGGMRAHEIAKVFGVATGTVSAYLRGERVPKAANAQDIHQPAR
jgi:predicted transcriptional regulator